MFKDPGVRTPIINIRNKIYFFPRKHFNNVQFKTEVKIVLGQNMRGLVAAHEIAKVKIMLMFSN